MGEPLPVETSTPSEYRMKVLRSADADGRLYPPALQDWWAQMSLLMGLYMGGLIEKRGDGRMYHRGGPWFITESGRAEARKEDRG